MDADLSASDTSELSGGVLCDVALCGGFDAPADSLPGLVGVGGGVVDGDVVSGWVCWGLSVVSGFAASWPGVERLVDEGACSSGDGGLVDLTLTRFGGHPILVIDQRREALDGSSVAVSA